MNLAVLTCAFSGRPVAVDPELVGEVRDLSASNRTGQTRIVHRSNRRVHWEVVEPFAVVMARLEAAAGPGRAGATRRPAPADGSHSPATPTSPGSGAVTDAAARTFELLVERAGELPAGSPMTISSSLVLWLADRMTTISSADAAADALQALISCGGVSEAAPATDRVPAKPERGGKAVQQ